MVYTLFMLKTWTRELTNLIFIVLAILSAGLGVKGFLLSAHFIDGGVTGISMLVSSITGLPLAMFILIFNLPFVALAFRQIGPSFALRSALAITGFSLCIAFIPFPFVTPDKLLTAVFGGIFLGAGIGFAIRGGGVLDGTEIAALIISKSLHFLRVGDVILILNIFIFSAAAWVLGIESALYSVLTYFSASKAVDFVIRGIEEYTAIIVMSEKSADIRETIVRVLNRGVTVFKGRGGLSGSDIDILYCVVTRLEIGTVKNAIHEIDDSAFIMIHPLADAIGGKIKQSALYQT